MTNGSSAAIPPSVRAAWLAAAVFCASATWGCAASHPQTLTVGTGDSLQRQGLDAFLKEHPLADGQPLRADLLVKNAASSVHIVQIREREKAHLHAEHDNSVVLLRGEGAIFLDGKPHEMKAGDGVDVQRGVPHFFVNLGSEPAVAFVVFAPPYDGTDQVPVAR